MKYILTLAILFSVCEVYAKEGHIDSQNPWAADYEMKIATTSLGSTGANETIFRGFATDYEIKVHGSSMSKIIISFNFSQNNSSMTVFGGQTISGTLYAPTSSPTIITHQLDVNTTAQVKIGGLVTDK